MGELASRRNPAVTRREIDPFRYTRAHANKLARNLSKRVAEPARGAGADYPDLPAHQRELPIALLQEVPCVTSNQRLLHCRRKHLKRCKSSGTAADPHDILQPEVR